MKKGFTLVELLAVIIILAVVLVIAIPKIGTVINTRRQQNFITSAKNIARQLSYENIESYDFTSAKLVDLDIQLSNDYDKTKSIAYISNDEVYVNVIGKGKFAGMNVCNVNYRSQDVTIQSTPCEEKPDIYVKLVVNLNGGQSNQRFSRLYAQGTQIELSTPTWEGYTFDGWKIVTGDSTLSGNTLTIGTTETSVYAMWK